MVQLLIQAVGSRVKKDKSLPSCNLNWHCRDILGIQGLGWVSPGSKSFIQKKDNELGWSKAIVQATGVGVFLRSPGRECCFLEMSLYILYFDY